MTDGDLKVIARSRDACPIRRNRGKSGKFWVRAVLVLAISLLAIPEGASGFGVGHRTVTYTDPARANRSIATEIYYPADAPGESVPVADGVFPVIAFGHGYLLPWSVYEYVWSGIVPDGYIVALPRTEGSLLPSHGEFGKDLAFLVSKLQSDGADPSSAFFGHVASTSAAMGHSMGGGASVLALQENPSITALANLAAAETSPSAIAAAGDISAPALLFSGSFDCVAPPEDHQIPIFNALASACKTHVTITGGSHCQFAAYSFTCSLGEGSCPSPGVSRDQQHALTLALLLPWLDANLKGDAGAWAQFEDLLAAGAGITWEQSCPAAGIDTAEDDSLPPRRNLRCYPNPFYESVTFILDPGADEALLVTICDVTGREMRSSHLTPAGHQDSRVVWDGLDRNGRAVPPGIYFCRVTTPAGSRTCPVLRLRGAGGDR